jgi:enolase
LQRPLGIDNFAAVTQSALITDVHADEILDSRGNPTVRVWLTAGGAVGVAMVPSGASTGEHEALELRDGDPRRYGGKGVLRAIANIHEVIRPKVVGMDVFDQAGIDARMLEIDGSGNCSHLGANAILGVSLAAAHTGAKVRDMPLYRYLNEEASLLPVPLLNVINGGVHAQNNLDFQEFMFVPHGFDSFAEALRAGAECFASLRKVLHDLGYSTGQGDEGGFAPSVKKNDQVPAILIKAIEGAGYDSEEQVSLALDPAASEFYVDERYHLRSENRRLRSVEMVGMWLDWCNRYPIVSLEDGMAQDDWNGWRDLTRELGTQLQLVGDDLFATQVSRLEHGIDERCATAILIKPNQNGTLTGTLEACDLAKHRGFARVISHRSGETEDTTIADLAVATGAGQIKAGAPSRSERCAKYNRLLAIERELGDKARFLGSKTYKRTRDGSLTSV